MSNSLRPHGLHQTRLPCPSLSPRVCSSLCPLNQWCHLTISSCMDPFSAYLHSLPAWEAFPMSWLFTLGDQSIGASASELVLPMNIQGWFPLGLTGLISLLSNGLARVFSNTQLESISSLPLSLLCGPALTSIHDYWKNHSFDYTYFCQQSDVSSF